ncbi:MAG: iron chelate uptake ABC transporter family permease subunit [Haemophilus parainfluenzae]
MPYFVQRNPKLFFTSLVILLVGTILLSLNVGRFPISPLQLGQAIRCVFETECRTPSSVETVLWHIRTPRIFVACLVGAALAAAGATYQGMFKNPLVSPDILGFAVRGLVRHWRFSTIYRCFTCSFLPLVAVSWRCYVFRWSHPEAAIKIRFWSCSFLGIAIGSLLGAGISLLKILARSFHPITFDYLLLLGSFTAVGVKN